MTRPPEVKQVAGAWAQAGQAAGLTLHESTSVVWLDGEWSVGPTVERAVGFSLVYREGQWALADHVSGRRIPLASTQQAVAAASAAYG